MRTEPRVERVQVGPRRRHREHHRQLQLLQVHEQPAPRVPRPGRSELRTRPRRAAAHFLRDRAAAAAAVPPAPAARLARGRAGPRRPRCRHGPTSSRSSATASSRTASDPRQLVPNLSKRRVKIESQRVRSDALSIDKNVPGKGAQSRSQVRSWSISPRPFRAQYRPTRLVIHLYVR